MGYNYTGRECNAEKLTELTLPQLGELFNEMVTAGHSLGLNRFQYKQVHKFDNKEIAIKQCETLYSSVVAAHQSQQITDQEDKNPDQDSSPPKRGRKSKVSFPLDAKIELLHQGKNPKSRGPAIRFSFYENGMTVQDYVDKVEDQRLAFADLVWDQDRHWIRVIL